MNKIQFSKTEVIKKGWGREEVITNNDKYCGKLLIYDRAGIKSSFHLHGKKQEHFYILGNFNFYYKDDNGNTLQKYVSTGDVISIPVGQPHQIESLCAGTIFEVSTTHSDDDVIRIAPGASQQVNL
jgi:mannose-6-phosphate isomerase-like protein (cupin superfamily)